MIAAITATRPRCQRAEPHVVVENHVLTRPNVVAGANADVVIPTNYQRLRRNSQFRQLRLRSPSSVDSGRAPPLAATDHRTRITGNPGLRRGLLLRAGSRMGEMGWPAALCRRADVELPTDADEEVASWIAEHRRLLRVWQHTGRISRRHGRHDRVACAQLGERALVCSAETGLSHVPHLGHEA